MWYNRGIEILSYFEHDRPERRDTKGVNGNRLMMGRRYWWLWIFLFLGPAVFATPIAAMLVLLYDPQSRIVVGIAICCLIPLIWAVKRREQEKGRDTHVEHH